MLAGLCESSAPAGPPAPPAHHFMMAGPPPSRAAPGPHRRRRSRSGPAGMPYGYPPHGPMQVEMVPQARCTPLRNYSRGAPRGSPSTLPRSQDSQTHMIMVTTPYGYGQSPPDYAQMAQYFASMAAQQQDQIPPGDYGRPAYYPAEPVGYKPPGAALVAKKVVEARPKPTVAARPVAPVLATKAVLPPPLTAPLGRPAAPAMHPRARRRGGAAAGGGALPAAARAGRRAVSSCARRQGARRAAAAAVREARQARHVWLLVQVVPAEPQRPRRHPRVTSQGHAIPPPSKTPFPGPWHLSAVPADIFSDPHAPSPQYPDPVHPHPFPRRDPPFPGRRPPDARSRSVAPAPGLSPRSGPAHTVPRPPSFPRSFAPARAAAGDARATAPLVVIRRALTGRADSEPRSGVFVCALPFPQPRARAITSRCCVRKCITKNV